MIDFTGLAANLIAAIKDSMARGETGGTYVLEDGTARDFTPTAGLYTFAIGGAGEEYRVKRLTARGVAAWMNRNTGALMSSGHVGYWIHEGEIYLDITTIWAGTDYDKTRAKALELGAERDEISIYDFHTGNCPAVLPATA